MKNLIFALFLLLPLSLSAQRDSALFVSKRDTIRCEWLIYAGDIGLLRKVYEPMLVRTFEERRAKVYPEMFSHQNIRHQRFYLNGTQVDVIAYRQNGQVVLFPWQDEFNLDDK